MARIRTYTGEIAAQGRISSRQASGADFYQDAGISALGAIASDIERRNNRADAKAERDAMFGVRRDMAQARGDWAATFDERVKNAPAGADKFTEGFLGDFDKYAEKFKEDRAELPENARMELETSLLEQRNFLQSQATSFEAKSRANKLRTDAEGLADTATRMTFTDPARFEYERDQYGKTVDGLDLPADVKHALKAETFGKVASSAVQGLIQKGRLVEAEKAIKEGPIAEHIDGARAAQLANSIDAERKRQETQRQLTTTQAGIALRSAQDRMLAGYDLPADEQAQLGALVKQSGDARVNAQFTQMKLVQQDVANWRKLTPQQLQDQILTSYDPAVRQNGATEYEATRLEMAQRALGHMNNNLKADPIGFAAGQGTVAVKPLDMGNPASIAERAASAQTVAKAYGTTAFFSDTELPQIKQQYANMSPDERVSFSKSLRQNAGPLAMTALGQLSKDNLTDAYIGGLAASGQQHEAVAANAWRGLQIIAADKTRVPSTEQVNPVFRSLIGDANQYLPPETISAVKSTADALYVQAGGDPRVIDNTKYTSALRQAMGGVGKDGGFARINGATTILPPAISEAEFKGFLGKASDADWASVSVTGNGPVYRNGTPAKPDDIADEGKFYMVGPNRYMVVMGSDNLPLLDPSGNYFTVNLAPDAVRKRSK